MELDNLQPKFEFKVLKAEFMDLKANGANFKLKVALDNKKSYAGMVRQDLSSFRLLLM